MYLESYKYLYLEKTVPEGSVPWNENRWQPLTTADRNRLWPKLVPFLLKGIWLSRKHWAKIKLPPKQLYAYDPNQQHTPVYFRHHGINALLQNTHGTLGRSRPQLAILMSVEDRHAQQHTAPWAPPSWIIDFSQALIGWEQCTQVLTTSSPKAQVTANESRLATDWR